jgi:hypothetical protein
MGKARDEWVIRKMSGEGGLLSREMDVKAEYYGIATMQR